MVSLCEFNLREIRTEDCEEAQLFQASVREGLRVASALLRWGYVARLPKASERVLAALDLLRCQQTSFRLRVPPQNLLAELLGLRRESVGRELKRLAQRGALAARGRGMIELLNPGFDTEFRRGLGAPQGELLRGRDKKL
ncbi:MAG: hypothetical protein OHK0048_24200 [Rhodoferax sp.]